MLCSSRIYHWELRRRKEREFNMNIIKRNKGLLAILAFLILAISCITLTKQLDVKADKGSVNYSFATMAEAATQYLNHANKPDEDGESDGLVDICDTFDFTQAGGLLGYEDSEVNDKDSVFIVTSTKSNNAVTYNYSAIAGLKLSERTLIDIILGRDNTSDVFSQYAYFGHALECIGFDETSVNGKSDNTRMIVGIIFIAGYILSLGLSVFFELIFTMLEFANPFRLFAGAITSISEHAVASMDTGGLSTFEYAVYDALLDIAGAFESIYSVLYDMSLFVILPVTLAITIFIWLIVNKGTHFWKTWKGFFVKLMFAIIGIPFMFSCYTIMIEKCKDVSHRTVNSSEIVASTFLDFEAWVIDSNLRLPNDYTILYNTSTSSLESSTISNIRPMCAAINKETGAVPVYYNGSWSLDSATQLQQYNSFNNKSTSYCIALLQKYARGDKISASAYEAAAKAGLDDVAAYVAMCQLSSHWSYFISDNAIDVPISENSGGNKFTADYVAKWAANRWSESTWDYSESSWLGLIVSSSSVENIWANGGGNIATPVTFAGNDGKFIEFAYNQDTNGLTTMSMYNYLLTDFDANLMTVYSSLNSANDQVTVEHYAVNMVGTGMIRILYLFDALVFMVCISVIGYGYGFAVLIGNFKAIFKMLPSVITGMLGSMRGIATALALTAAMICEVVVTMLLYGVACDIIKLAYDVVDGPLALLFETENSGLNKLMNGLAEIMIPLMGVISIVIIVAVTKKMLEWRHAVVQSTVDVCTSMINKFLGTQVASPDLDSSASGLGKLMNAASIATGLAMSSGALTDSDTFQSAKDKAGDLKDKASDKILGKDGDTDLANAFGVKEGNGTGVNENGELAKSKGVDSAELESSLAGEDGVLDERGNNLSNAAEEYLANNDEESLFGDNSDASKLGVTAGAAALGVSSAQSASSKDKSSTDKDNKSGRKLTASEAKGVHKDNSGKLVDSEGNSVLKNEDGSYSYEASDDRGKYTDAEGNPVTRNSDGTFADADGNPVDAREVLDENGESVAEETGGDYDYYKNIPTDNSDAMLAYEQSDLADDGVRNHSADADKVLSEHNQKQAVKNNKGGAFNRGINARPKQSAEYAQRYDDAYADADWADDGELNESVQTGGYGADGRLTASANMSDAYKSNYSQEYAEADYADDGQYNGSVQVAEADVTDKNGNTVRVAARNSSGQYDMANNQPSAAYAENYSQEYADADFTDDGKYNGSVGRAATKTSSGKIRPNQRPSQAYQQNYSEEYAAADFTDDGQYNGSVEVAGTNSAGKFVSSGKASQTYQQNYTQEYANADVTDDGQYNGSVQGVGTKSGKVTVAPTNIPSQAYQQNYSQEYAEADYADNKQYDGSVQVAGRNSSGKFTQVSSNVKPGTIYVDSNFEAANPSNDVVQSISTGQPNVVQRQNAGGAFVNNQTVYQESDSNGSNSVFVDVPSNETNDTVYVQDGSNNNRVVVTPIITGGGNKNTTNVVNQSSKDNTPFVHVNASNGNNGSNNTVNMPSGGGSTATEYVTVEQTTNDNNHVTYVNKNNGSSNSRVEHVSTGGGSTNHVEYVNERGAGENYHNHVQSGNVGGGFKSKSTTTTKKGYEGSAGGSTTYRTSEVVQNVHKTENTVNSQTVFNKTVDNVQNVVNETVDKLQETYENVVNTSTTNSETTVNHTETKDSKSRASRGISSLFGGGGRRRNSDGDDHRG